MKGHGILLVASSLQTMRQCTKQNCASWKKSKEQNRAGRTVSHLLASEKHGELLKVYRCLLDRQAVFETSFQHLTFWNWQSDNQSFQLIDWSGVQRYESRQGVNFSLKFFTEPLPSFFTWATKCNMVNKWLSQSVQDFPHVFIKATETQQACQSTTGCGH